MLAYIFSQVRLPLGDNTKNVELSAKTCWLQAMCIARFPLGKEKVLEVQIVRKMVWR